MIDMVKYGEIREAQGEFKGERKKAIETAINLIKMGILTFKQIAQSTGLTEEDIMEAKGTIDKKRANNEIPLICGTSLFYKSFLFSFWPTAPPG